MKILTNAPPGSPDWQAAHKGRIGGASVADVLGVGRNTPLRRWAIITGKIEPEDISQLPHIKLGNKLEPVVIEMYQEETKRVVAASPGCLQDEEFEWLIGTPDGLVFRNVEGWSLTPPEPHGVYEGKTAGSFMRSDWDADVPVPYRIQLQTYLRLTGCEWGSFGALIGGSDFLWKDEPRNDAFIDWMIERLNQFWEKHVKTDIPPEPAWGDNERNTVNKLCGASSPGKTIAFSSDLLALTSQYDELEPQRIAARDALKAIESAQDVVENKIKMAMGDAEKAIGPDAIWTYESKAQEAYTVAARVNRRLTRKKVR